MSVLEKPGATNSNDIARAASVAPAPLPFAARHIGPRPDEARQMLDLLGFADLDALIDAAVPESIRLRRKLNLPPARSESEALADLRAIASQNQVFRSFIGMGYSDCVTPAVIQRNVLENPGWYTQYTPYQAEISQGRLEALLIFQTMVADLTDLEIANASLLDEATAAAEAMTMCHALQHGRNAFFVSDTCHPQNIAVVQTRARALGIDVMVGPAETFVFTDKVFGALVQYPDTFGRMQDLSGFVDGAHAAGAKVAVSADLLALTLVRPPGEFGADIAVGSAQRFGVPLGYGGPHAGYFATREAFKRHMPGRLVGMSKDSRGKPALRLALQTREQHIRREKATSNICTAQALLANMAALYAVYHGPAGLRAIASRVHDLTRVLAAGLTRLGCRLGRGPWFDTLRIEPAGARAAAIARTAEAHRMNFRVIDERTIGISLDETTSESDVAEIWQAFNGDARPAFAVADIRREAAAGNDNTGDLESFSRASPFLTHPVFNRYHSETEMLRYLKRLESRDLSLTASMIPLGSCTMKLNAAAEMAPLSWPEFARIHPFAPGGQARGYRLLLEQLEQWLAEITGFAAISFQPNAGSQGEYSGLLAIRGYHESRGEPRRRVCLIPASAHGTNPASAAMAGMNVVGVACDSGGNIDVADLQAKAESNRGELACVMVTYPSTHGVFEPTIREICRIVHANGGQVYMDGANLNAQVGLCRPGDMGADVCHLNLHKTFCIPHGGGGPGVGPIGVAAHLAPFVPGHPVHLKSHSGAVSSAPWGSASLLPISWMYVAMMGAEGLTEATRFAILNANYISRRLEHHFPTLYRNHGLVAHECILDLRRVCATAGGSEPGWVPIKSVTAEDVAKRLMDYGFHAPTLSWPVPGTLMVEPTESESKSELDRFCDAMVSIHSEMLSVETGRADPQHNVLKGAPHTADMVASDRWPGAYTREQAAYPSPALLEYKFWPHVGRVDNVFGDRNPVCTCAGMEDES